MDIPPGVTDTEIHTELPPQIAELPPESEPTETSPYVLSFGKYKDKLCEIDQLIGNKGKNVLSDLKKIGTKVKSFEDFKKNNFTVRPVKNEGDYKKLFNKLNEDIELKELIIGDKERIFFFIIESEKVICIVLIKASHFETNKNRK